MPPTKRFNLFRGSDGAWNARDDVIHYLVKQIEDTLEEGEPAFLNYSAAYIRCLISVIESVGGDEFVSEHVTRWRKKAFQIYDAMANNPLEETADERPFLISLFDDLESICKQSDEG